MGTIATSSTEKLQPTTSPPEKNSEYITGWRLFIVMASLFMGAFLMALDINIINIPVPIIATQFHALQDVAWYGSAYLLTITAFQPTFGTLYKFFKIDVIFCVCIIIFEVGSLLCAAATNSKMFIVGRAIAGFAAAGILQGVLAVIGQVVRLEQRPLYMGLVMSVFAITVCIGPVLGGVFTQHASWRWCFWINLPIGGVVFAVLLLILRVPGTKNANRMLPLSKKIKHLDPFGCVVFLGAVTCLLLALQWGGQTKPWNSATVIGLLVGFGLLSILFGFIQWKKGEEAAIPFRVLTKRSIWASAGVLFFMGATVQVISFYIPFYFQTVQGVSPVQAGVRFIALILPQTIAVVVVGALVAQFGYYVPYMLAGELICLVGVSLLVRLTPTSNTITWAAPLVVQGLGMGMALQLPYTAVQVVLKEDDVPIGNAILVFAWQLGGAIAIAISQTILLNTLVDRVAQALPGLTGQAVIAAGAVNLLALAKTAERLRVLRGIWNTAIVRIVYLAIALSAAAIPFTLGMEWLNTKRVAEQRRLDAAVENSHEREVEGEKESV
ncbi:major facilitator superfamily domain-containing protein [Lophiotrema nucula]|uniref:Major facilitator superfamily domain-containing protein n=1 Tax=Lophiotrema nucula TaxID=690887 RepID=A0A6A5ZR65_9PLEO|nr:major facilitator superfamily domain-containing protein [Lophiotrema nucula]